MFQPFYVTVGFQHIYCTLDRKRILLGGARSRVLFRYMHSAQYSKALPLLTEQLETLRGQAVRDEVISVCDLLCCGLFD